MTIRQMCFVARTVSEARQWQARCRQKLFELMMGGGQPARVPLEPQVLNRFEQPAGGYVVQEVTLQTLPDRRVHAWLALPLKPSGKAPAILALHGHGGTGEQVVKGVGLYWYGRALAEMGYVVMAPDIGSHDLQHSGWSLMGERVWDCLCCLDYLCTIPQVDARRIGVCGLSLGGETTMYIAALDERVKIACSSGWLTTVQNMKNGHCPCWNFAGLEEHFDFADIFACVAPRVLICELGEGERAPGGFPIEIARQPAAEIAQAYRVFRAEQNFYLDTHPGGHIFQGNRWWAMLPQVLGQAYPWRRERDAGREALRRAEIARRAFCRAMGVLDGWWAIRDRQTDLLPRRTDQRVWAPNDNAADLAPFLYLTAYFLAPERQSEIQRTFTSERRITNRLGVLPDWYDMEKRTFVHPDSDIRRLLFGAAEYCKDGLLPMTEVMGRGWWTERMTELVEAIFEHAPIRSEFGNLPADDTEVNGELLQVLSRLYAMTRDGRYLRWAERIGDAYCLEVIPRNGGLPAHRWDFSQHKPINDVLSLNDHGNEIIGGLAELYLMMREANPPKARRYLRPLQQMFSRLLQKARNADGLWYGLLTASTAEVRNPAVPDTWGYALSGVYTFGLTTGDETFTDAARLALERIYQPQYLLWEGADSFADAIEGALLLLNRLPIDSGFRWLEAELPLFLGKQREDGIVEGWYGDGNYARTALMVGLYFTQGVIPRPWRPDLLVGAVRNGDSLTIALSAGADWQGILLFDHPRHREHLNLPTNYPRLNEFPEWFTVQADRVYRVRVGHRERRVTGEELRRGYPVTVRRGETQIVVVH
ncbi:MAG: acetylxylan esterase [Chthonomonadetes bacterium]|nr:acetylxylan esterase [Chthonomonadetes bacterium]